MLKMTENAKLHSTEIYWDDVYYDQDRECLVVTFVEPLEVEEGFAYGVEMQMGELVIHDEEVYEK